MRKKAGLAILALAGATVGTLIANGLLGRSKTATNPTNHDVRLRCTLGDFREVGMLADEVERLGWPVIDSTMIGLNPEGLAFEVVTPAGTATLFETEPGTFELAEFLDTTGRFRDLGNLGNNPQYSAFLTAVEKHN